MKTLLALLILTLTLCISGCSKDSDESGVVGGSGNDGVSSAPRTSNPPVTTQRYPGLDGKGIRWKPISEKGTLAVLLARSYGNPPVKIKNSRNEIVAVGDFVYFSNPDRATYRFPRQGSAYSGGYLIVGSQIFTIGNGGREVGK